MSILRTKISASGRRRELSSLADRGFKTGDLVHLLDASGYLFRAYHALPPLTRASDGTPVGAVAGMSNMLYKMLGDLAGDQRPSHVVAVFDKGSYSFRNEIYPDYKANRPSPPEDLAIQFPLVREATAAFGLPVIEKEGYEADDIIATLAREAAQGGAKVVILSSDKDLMQLVDEQITLLDPMKNRPIGRDEVFEKFGVEPSKVIDVQALAGDSVDNVPGIPGIGIKTAASLIHEFGSLEVLLEHAGSIKQPKRRQSLIEHAENARVSKHLVTLRDDVPLDLDADQLRLHSFDPDKALLFCKKMEFRTLTKRIAEQHDVAEVVQAQVPAAHNIQAPAAHNIQAPAAQNAQGDMFQQAMVVEDPQLSRPLDAGVYTACFSLTEIENLVLRARAQGYVAVDTETDALDSVAAGLVGISLAVIPGQAMYIPLAHQHAKWKHQDVTQLPIETVRNVLSPLFADKNVIKIGQNIKYDLQVLKRHGMPITCYDDTMLMSYVLAAGRHPHGMDSLSVRYFDHRPISFEDVAGKGSKQVSFADVGLDAAVPYAAEDADITLRLWLKFRRDIMTARKKKVYETVERPLAEVIARMEMHGICVSRERLKELSNILEQQQSELSAEIYGLAEKEFNIGSPKQLGSVLFEDLGLPSPAKTKTGGYQTGSDVLEDLAIAGHVIAEKVLSWRQVAKLRSTYTEALQHFIKPITSRIHTSFSLSATSTGRLSSSDPNLQNIPIRTAMGRDIRTAFVPAEGFQLMSADYSQIELRLLAHIADIPALKDAFYQNQDIHAMTASEVFGVPLDGMDPMLRRQAKAINFGIIYGISPFGLARQLGIKNDMAKQYIDAYFAKFPGIKGYMEDTKEFARQHGYVETIFGRRVHTPAVMDKQPATRAFGERAAINAPIQGAAADIMKRAMIQLHQHSETDAPFLRMLLQVHDELIFEVAIGHEQEARRLVQHVMEHAHEPLVNLSVPLEVVCGIGPHWGAIH